MGYRALEIELKDLPRKFEKDLLQYSDKGNVLSSPSGKLYVFDSLEESESPHLKSLYYLRDYSDGSLRLQPAWLPFSNEQNITFLYDEKGFVGFDEKSNFTNFPNIHETELESNDDFDIDIDIDIETVTTLTPAPTILFSKADLTTYEPFEGTSDAQPTTNTNFIFRTMIAITNHRKAIFALLIGFAGADLILAGAIMLVPASIFSLSFIATTLAPFIAAAMIVLGSLLVMAAIAIPISVKLCQIADNSYPKDEGRPFEGAKRNALKLFIWTDTIATILGIAAIPSAALAFALAGSSALLAAMAFPLGIAGIATVAAVGISLLAVGTFKAGNKLYSDCKYKQNIDDSESMNLEYK